MEIELLHYVNKVTLFVVVEWTIGSQQQWDGLFMPKRTQYIALIQLAPFHSIYMCVCVCVSKLKTFKWWKERRAYQHNTFQWQYSSQYSTNLYSTQGRL